MKSRQYLHIFYDSNYENSLSLCYRWAHREEDHVMKVYTLFVVPISLIILSLVVNYGYLLHICC